MSRSITHTGTRRAIEQFRHYTRIGRELGLTRQLIEDERFRGQTIRLNGVDVQNFGLCSYLGLGDDERLVEAAIDATRRYGNSYSSSSAYTALPLYGELRDRLDHMLGAPVVVAGTTTLAHMAALPVLVRGGETVLVDAFAHASLRGVLPALASNGASVVEVAHNDLAEVGRFVEASSERVWYLADGLYSMFGDTSPAERLRSMLDAHPNLWIYVDDAHSLGWAGVHGRGQFLDRAGWHERIVMSFGLAKSFGTMGGVIATPDPELVELVEVTGGPMVFGGPLPPSTLGASIASADIHLSDELPGLQEELLQRIDLVNEYAEEIGLPLASMERTPLWFVEIGQVLSTISAAAVMLSEGFFVNTAVFPAVPRGRGGLRFTVTRYNDLDRIREMLVALRDVQESHAGPDATVDLTALERIEG